MPVLYNIIIIYYISIKLFLARVSLMTGTIFNFPVLSLYLYQLVYMAYKEPLFCGILNIIIHVKITSIVYTSK